MQMQGYTHMGTANLEISEQLLGDLYQSAMLESPDLFQDVALRNLHEVIGFDRAWWGIMSPASRGFQLHSSYRHELPAAFEAHWKEVSSDDALASNVHSKPRTTVHFSYKDLHSTPGLLSLNLEHNLQQALCTSVFLPDRKSFLFISLFRSGKYAKAFSQQDIAIKQRMTPHLYASWKTNLQAEIERTRIPNRMLGASSAFVDSTGTIVCADAAFTAMLSDIWPTWTGGKQLPVDFWQSQDKRATPTLTVNTLPCGGLMRIDVAHSSRFNKLSQREKQIASEYSEGLSYKEIAAFLNISPATVRHYLQMIYEKLGIRDKAELVRISDAYHRAAEVMTLTSGAARGRLVTNL